MVDSGRQCIQYKLTSKLSGDDEEPAKPNEKVVNPIGEPTGTNGQDYQGMYGLICHIISSATKAQFLFGSVLI